MSKLSAKELAAKRGTEWRKALFDGRIVRYNNGQSFKQFKTHQEALDFVKEADDIEFQIVEIPQ